MDIAANLLNAAGAPAAWFLVPMDERQTDHASRHRAHDADGHPALGSPVAESDPAGVGIGRVQHRLEHTADGLRLPELERPLGQGGAQLVAVPGADIEVPTAEARSWIEATKDALHKSRPNLQTPSEPAPSTKL